MDMLTSWPPVILKLLMNKEEMKIIDNNDMILCKVIWETTGMSSQVTFKITKISISLSQIGCHIFHSTSCRFTEDCTILLILLSEYNFFNLF